MKKVFLYIYLTTWITIGYGKQDVQDSLTEIIQNHSGDKRIDARIKLSAVRFEQDPMAAIEIAQKAVNECKSTSNNNLLSSAYLNLGQLYQKTTSYELALYYIKKSLEVKKDNKDIARILDNVGVVYRELGKYDSALIFHKQALKFCETAGDKKGAASALNNEGNVFSRKGDMLLAIDYYQQSLKIRQENGLYEDIAASFENIGDAYKRMNDYDKAHEYLFKSLSMRQEQGDKEKEAACLNIIGNFYMQMKIYDKAREYYSKALDIRISVGNISNIASTYNNIGTLHREISNYDKALEYYQKALDLRKKTGNKEAIATSFNSIGSLYWNKKDYPQAVEYYKMALDIRRELGEKAQVAATLKNLGIIYKDRSDYQRALDYYQQSLDIYLIIKDYIGIASIQNLKGNLFKKMNDLKKSNEFYINSFDIYKEYNQKKEMAAVSNNIGETFIKNKQPEKSIKYYNIALGVATDVKDNEIAKIAALGLADAFKRTGNLKKSLEFYELFSNLKDSIQNDQNKKRIAEIEFETAIKLKDNKITTQQLKIKQNEAKIKQQHSFIVGIVLIAVLAILFTIIILVQFNQKKKAYQLLAEKSRQLADANSLLGIKNRELGIKNDQITDSITYAKRIQEAILPGDDIIDKLFPNHFIFFRPKEIVSGDFYWVSHNPGYTFVAVVDCTGHGVPGAFMSMIGNTLLNEIVNVREIFDTAEVLQQLDAAIITALKQDSPGDKRQEDGMDITLCKIDTTRHSLEVASANHKLVIINKGELKTVGGDGYAIGGMVKIKQRKNISHSSQTIQIEPGMRIYMHSDGFIDQFGGDNNERFKSPKFYELLKDIQHYDMHEQYMTLSKRFDEWKGTRKQLDDVLIFGIEF